MEVIPPGHKVAAHVPYTKRKQEWIVASVLRYDSEQKLYAVQDLYPESKKPKIWDIAPHKVIKFPCDKDEKFFIGDKVLSLWFIEESKDWSSVFYEAQVVDIKDDVLQLRFVGDNRIYDVNKCKIVKPKRPPKEAKKPIAKPETPLPAPPSPSAPMLVGAPARHPRKNSQEPASAVIREDGLRREDTKQRSEDKPPRKHPSPTPEPDDSKPPKRQKITDDTFRHAPASDFMPTSSQPYTPSTHHHHLHPYGYPIRDGLANGHGNGSLASSSALFSASHPTHASSTPDTATPMSIASPIPNGRAPASPEDIAREDGDAATHTPYNPAQAHLYRPLPCGVLGKKMRKMYQLVIERQRGENSQTTQTR